MIDRPLCTMPLTWCCFSLLTVHTWSLCLGHFFPPFLFSRKSRLDNDPQRETGQSFLLRLGRCTAHLISRSRESSALTEKKCLGNIEHMFYIIPREVALRSGTDRGCRPRGFAEDRQVQEAALQVKEVLNIWRIDDEWWRKTISASTTR